MFVSNIFSKGVYIVKLEIEYWYDDNLKTDSVVVEGKLPQSDNPKELNTVLKNLVTENTGRFDIKIRSYEILD